jgi:glutathione peroxidase
MYAGQDLVILGYPCNQFGLQEPGSGYEEIMNGVRYVRPGGNFIPKLDRVFEKVDVNGANEIPFYTYLKATCGPTFTQFEGGLYYEPLRVGDLNWNFEKFLIGRDGKPYTRYHPSVVNTDGLSPDIDALLAQAPPKA